MAPRESSCRIVNGLRDFLAGSQPGNPVWDLCRAPDEEVAESIIRIAEELEKTAERLREIRTPVLVSTSVETFLEFLARKENTPVDTAG
jgi:hypothetical protein